MRLSMLAGVTALAASACASADEAGSQGADVARGLEFHGELAALNDFSYDTGPLPQSAPGPRRRKR